MITKKHVEYLYPTPIHTIDFLDTSFCDEIKKHLKNLQKNNIGRDDVLCFITPDDLHKRTEFLNLNEILLKETNKVLDEIGLSTTDFSGYVAADPIEHTDLGLRYEEFISPIVKAIQELSSKVDRLEAEISSSKI